MGRHVANNDEKKEAILKEIVNCKGFVFKACRAAKVPPRTYCYWRTNDPNFADEVDELVEFFRLYRKDIGEEKLMERVEDGDTHAIIFFNKTQNKDRGYTDRDNYKQKPDPQTSYSQLSLPGKEVPKANVVKKIKGKKDYITKLLKEEGKYTKELSMQVNLVAQLMVRTDELRDIIFSEKHSPVSIETSREGNDRFSINPVERLYLDYAQRTQRALQALGMNTDSKERKTDNDGFNDYLSDLRNDE